VERWPPVYDFAELQGTIRSIVDRDDLRKAFYAPSLREALQESGPLCQGDILQLRSPAPVIDENGDAIALGDFEHWLVVGNTSDFERPIADIAWTQVVPIVALRQGVTEEHKRDLLEYRLSKAFYVPDWTGTSSEPVLMADLCQPAALHKETIGKAAQVVGRMTQLGWILLHACLVRFLARDDGRFD
jgi:hypothetical protein